jgi:hypothetical protein
LIASPPPENGAGRILSKIHSTQVATLRQVLRTTPEKPFAQVFAVIAITLRDAGEAFEKQFAPPYAARSTTTSKQ